MLHWSGSIPGAEVESALEDLHVVLVFVAGAASLSSPDEEKWLP